jgi:hypothetical protein
MEVATRELKLEFAGQSRDSANLPKGEGAANR